jgi:hypothetical protein
MWINATARDPGDQPFMISRPLAREIAMIVAVKTAILIAAGLLVFGPNRLDVTATSVEAHVLHPAPEIR